MLSERKEFPLEWRWGVVGGSHWEQATNLLPRGTLCVKIKINLAVEMGEISPFRTDVLAGNVALVTGGSSGIGLEITRQLGLHGAKVVISGRRQNVLDDACQALSKDGITAHGVQVRNDSII